MGEERKEIGHILPDSRLRNPKNIISGPHGNWVPIYCANCGRDGGLVPEENCSFACWLCNECADTYGSILGTYMLPDEVFWKKVEEAQMEKYKKILCTEELEKVLDNVNDPFTKLVNGK
jgi:hypothetical protein